MTTANLGMQLAFVLLLPILLFPRTRLFAGYAYSVTGELMWILFRCYAAMMVFSSWGIVGLLIGTFINPPTAWLLKENSNSAWGFLQGTGILIVSMIAALFSNGLMVGGIYVIITIAEFVALCFARWGGIGIIKRTLYPANGNIGVSVFQCALAGAFPILCAGIGWFGEAQGWIKVN
jgi:hypothetical protein